MTDLEKAARMALKTLEYIDLQDNDRDFLSYKECHTLDEAITALSQALSNSVEQPAQQEPVGEVYRHGRDSHGREWHGIHWYDANVDVPHGTKLYTSPQPAQQEPFKPDWVNYRQGVEDGRAEALEMLAKQEPVAWRVWRGDAYELFFSKYAADRRADCFTKRPDVEPLYTSPQRKPWVGLTEEERKRAIQFNNAHEALAVVIEAKLKEKNA